MFDAPQPAQSDPLRDSTAWTRRSFKPHDDSSSGTQAWVGMNWASGPFAGPTSTTDLRSPTSDFLGCGRSPRCSLPQRCSSKSLRSAPSANLPRRGWCPSAGVSTPMSRQSSRQGSRQGDGAKIAQFHWYTIHGLGAKGLRLGQALFPLHLDGGFAVAKHEVDLAPARQPPIRDVNRPWPAVERSDTAGVRPSLFPSRRDGSRKEGGGGSDRTDSGTSNIQH